MTREELIARIENAIEGGRELDANIAAHTTGARAYYVTDADRPADADAGEWLVLNQTEEGFVSTHRPPRYTNSLDAAVSLIPLGLGWELTYRRSEHVYAAAIGSHRNPDTGRYDRYEMLAKTAPLAVSGAAIKAHEPGATRAND